MTYKESGYFLSIQGLIFQIASVFHIPNPYIVGVLVSVMVLVLLAVFWSIHHHQRLFMFSTVPLTILVTVGHINIHDAVLMFLPFFIWYQVAPHLSQKYIWPGWLILLFTFYTPTKNVQLLFLPQLFLLGILFLQLYYIATRYGEKRKLANDNDG
jgi:hypothetical protein